MSGLVEEPLPVSPDELEWIEPIARKHGVRIERLQERGLDPVSTITLLLIGSTAAVLTVQRIVDERRGGQVIDLRTGAPKMVYRSSDLHYGLVLVQTHDGRVIVQQIEPNSSFSSFTEAIVQVVTAARGSSASAIKSVLEGSLPAGQAALHADDDEGGGDGH